MKKVMTLIALALCLCLALTACTGNNASKGDKILNVQVGPDPETLDPALNSAVDGGNMLLHTFECLLTVDQNGVRNAVIGKCQEPRRQKRVSCVQCFPDRAVTDPLRFLPPES